MNRYCFQLQVDPAHVDEYRRRHCEVWPDMLRALSETGWRNYSLFLRADGLLIGYLESELSLPQLQDAMARREVNARWQAEMAGMFVNLEGTPDAGLLLLEEVFHLEDQFHSAE